MRISAKAEYACLAVLDLAVLRERPEPVRVADLAERNHIPERFLVQILLQLKGAGYVQSVRGAAGGYRLRVSPEQISLWDVIHLVDGASTKGISHEGDREGRGWTLLKNVWQTINRHEETKLKQTDFAKLISQLAHDQAQKLHL